MSTVFITSPRSNKFKPGDFKQIEPVLSTRKSQIPIFKKSSISKTNKFSHLFGSVSKYRPSEEDMDKLRRDFF